MTQKKNPAHEAMLTLDAIAAEIDGANVTVAPYTVDLGKAGIIEFSDFYDWSGDRYQDALELAETLNDVGNMKTDQVMRLWLTPADYKKAQAAKLNLRQCSVIVLKATEYFYEKYGLLGE